MIIRIFCLAILLACGSAWADTIGILFDTTPITAAPGQQITFTANVQNNVASTVDLNNISVTLNGLFTIDVTPFFSGPVSVDPGMAIHFDLFSVAVGNPYTDPLGLKTGAVTILGGIEGPAGYDPATQDVLGSATFQVNVANSGAAVPEPSSLCMLSSVMLAFVLRRYSYKSGN